MTLLARCTATLFIAGTIVFPLAMDSGPASASSNRTHLLIAWKALENDYNHIEAAINANSTTNAESGFIDYSRDCIPLATFETSFSPTINADIFSIAQLGNAWAWIGYITIDSNSGVSTFKTETVKLTAAIDKFNRDLS